MLVGHYGPAFALKGAEKTVPLWVLFVFPSSPMLVILVMVPARMMMTNFLVLSVSI